MNEGWGRGWAVGGVGAFADERTAHALFSYTSNVSSACSVACCGAACRYQSPLERDLLPLKSKRSFLPLAAVVRSVNIVVLHLGELAYDKSYSFVHLLQLSGVHIISILLSGRFGPTF